MMQGARIARPIWNPELAVFTVLSGVLHFARLFSPNAVLFDEAHYKRFAGHYLDGTFYYDVHPPLANLLYAAVAFVAGLWIIVKTLLWGERIAGFPSGLDRPTGRLSN